MPAFFWKISFRLPVIVLLAVALAALAVGAFSYQESSRSVRHQAMNGLVALRDARHAAVTGYFRSIEEDLALLATNRQVRDAIVEFRAAFGQLNMARRHSEETLLRRVYSPQTPAGEIKSDIGRQSNLVSSYFFAHGQYHSWFQTIATLKGYYDLFLISPTGDVIYSMFKEKDFATNLLQGEWRDTGLARAFRESLNAEKPDQVAFTVFQPYEPSNKAPASFLARRVFEDDRLVGVLALQMPIGRINEVLQVTAGMGATGESYLVGPDYLMHSDSRFSATSTILKTKIQTSAAKQALAGKSAVAIIDDYRGIPVYSAYRPFKFHGVNWALIAEKDVAEVQMPVEAMLRSIFFIGLALVLVVAAGGIFMASTFTRPLRALSESVKSFHDTRQAVELAEAGRKDEIGEIAVGFQAATREVSEYIDAINEAREELTQSAQELRAARDDAQAATEAKALFLATMSHEIRTPMTGVIGMVDLLTQSRLDDDQKQMAHTVRDSAYALLTIINDILDFSKIEAGKLELESSPFSIRDAVEGMAETLGPNANAKGIRINIHVDPDIPDAVLGDQVRIRQILFNIGGNAVKFTEQGRVFIRAFLLAEDAGNSATVRFEIIDSGIGISKEAQADLFTEFTQAESSTTRRFGGTGLGLSICQRLTEMMGGKIDVESELGEGSTFAVTLTFATADDHKIKSDGHDLSGLNVLFVGDDPEECELDANYLRHWGAAVSTAGDLQTVIPIARDAADRGASFEVIVLGSAWHLEERAKLARRIQAEDGIGASRFLMMTETRTRADRIDLENTVYVESDPLRRAPFIRAAAVAAGRASPDISYDDEEDIIEAIEAPGIEAAEAAGVLILVAEDNMTNQNVIRRQLNMLGYAVEMVDDGKQALEAWQQKDYAMLLTDCHMPTMDGFELTRAIRKDEGHEGKRLPIVAITASVLAAEIDRCYEAGMDDSLHKPLEMPKLKAALQKWMPASSSRNTGDIDGGVSKVELAGEPAEDVGKSVVNTAALSNVFGDDEAVIKEILKEFVEPATANMAEIMAAVEQRSADAVAAAAHKMKSSSRTIGADELADICQALESAGQSRDWDAIMSFAPRLPGEFQQVIDYIDSV